MKYLRKSLVSFLILSLCCVVPVSAKQKSSYNEIEEMLESFVYTFEGTVIDANFTKNLFDINGSESFGLFVFDNGGYAVVSLANQVISEILLNCNETAFLDDALYYLGPGSFFSSDNLGLMMNTQSNGLESNNQTDNEYINTVLATSRILSESNPNFAYQESIVTQSISPIIVKPSYIVGGAEIGISDNRMSEFKKVEWQNNNKDGKDYLYEFLGHEYGICGSISTSVALTYLDRYVNSNVVVNSPYSFPSSSYASWLILKFKNQIEPPLPGSFASDIIEGINWFYATTNSSISGTTLAPKKSTSESVYKNNISDGYPLIMYLDVMNSDLSPYGLHWVTAYRYVDYNGALWFKAADNWGNLAWINRNWVDCTVYFSH